MHIDIGIPDPQRAEIADGLKRVMADTYTLYLRTHRFHWNVTGPWFDTLHKMFELQYTELWAAVDLIAERIRSLGVLAPGTYQAFATLTSLDNVDSEPTADEMVRHLLQGHETVVRTIRAVLPVAQAASDESTAALLGDRLRVHEKTAWMLRSMAQRA